MSIHNGEGKKPKNHKKSGRWWVSLCLLVCLALLLSTWLFGQRFEAVRSFGYTLAKPVTRLVNKTAGAIEDLREQMQSKASLQAENDSLRDEVEDLEEQIRLLQSTARRTSELEELYQMDTYYKDYPKTGAQIVGLSPNNWYDTFVLDKGSADGIEEYMPVMAGNGLAGHISTVYENYSVVTSVVSQDSVIYGQINRANGDLVVVQGASGYSSRDTGTIKDDICMIRFVTEDVDITVGDEVVTSTLGDIYPPGLPIGTVTKIIPAGDGQESIAFLKPTVNLEQTDMVLIITQFWKEDMDSTLTEDSSAGEDGSESSQEASP